MNPQEIREIGGYRVRRFIAEGGMAWVFEVVDPKFDAPRALKMLKPGVAGGELFRRFRDEAKILARLDHPNLVTIYDFGLDEATGCHFYTMTLVDTPPLSKRGVLSLDQAAPILLGALAGLAKLHEGGIVHRDVKPGNILIHPDGRAMLADLGIARAADLGEGETWFTAAGHGTSTGMAIGTPAYMSPEQARGRRGIAKPTDVFSFGLTIYNTLTGRTIYQDVDGIDSSSGQEILAYLGHLSFSHREFEFHFREHEAPAAVQAVVRRACRIEPGERYPDAGAMRSALSEALRGPRRTVKARPERATTAERGAGAGRRLGLLAAVLAAVGLAVGAWYLFIHQGPIPPPDELQAKVARMLEVAVKADPPTAGDVLADARARQESADDSLQKGRTKQDRAERDAFLRDASEGYQQSCEVLVSRDLKARLASESGGVKRELEGLQQQNAKDLAPDAWSKLEQEIAGVEPPDASLASCDAAAEYQARIARMPALVADAQALGLQLARAAREAAARAQSEAAAARIDAPEFQTALERAGQDLSAGDAAQKTASYAAAGEAYSKARHGFGDAVAIARAWKARESARLAQAQAPKSDALAKEMARADELYAAGRFGEAQAAFEHAGELLRAATEASERVRLARKAADDARARALGQGAERSAPEELRRADELVGQASSAADQDRFDAAEKGYGQANAAFEAAGKAALASLEGARKAGAAARLQSTQLGDCSGLDEKQARPLCLAAAKALADGDALVKAGDAAGALARYDGAQRQLADAVEAQGAATAEKGRQRAELARSRANAARTQALADGAEKSARGELAQADAALRDAGAALDAKRFDDAEKGYGQASAAFEAAAKAALANLEGARKAGADARAQSTQLGDCAGLDEKQARPLCLAAAKALADGDASVKAGDAPAALDHYGAVRTQVADAQAAQRIAIDVRAKDQLRQRAALAQNAAADARKQALAAGAEKSARDELAQADAVLRDADALLKAERFDDAATRYASARAAFEAASNAAGNVAAATLDRARKAGAEASARAKQLGDCAGLDEKQARPLCLAAAKALADGDALVKAGDAAAALERYGGAERQLADALEAQGAATADKGRQRVELARSGANAARAQALADGAERSARDELARADATLRDAGAALDAKRFDDAARSFDSARAGFEAASKAALASLEGARKAGADARAQSTQLGECAGLDEKQARPLCLAAAKALADGDASVKAGDARTALDRYRSASQGFADARKAQDGSINRPPSIVSRKPAESNLEAHKNESLRFEVAAKDVNPGDVLHYVWTVDGQRQPASGSSLELRLQADSRVEVRVDDGHPDGVASASWSVVLKNRNPELKLSPAGDVTLDVDASQTFKARARDLDGDEVKVAFLLDGKPVAEGDSFTFSGRAPGTHVLEVRASDPSGGLASLKRTITVAGANHPPELALSPAQDAVHLEVGQQVAFAANASDPDGDEVKIAFLVDGKPVASRGGSYTFEGHKAGAFVLEARATDARGATTSAKRRIEVASSAPVQAATPQASRPDARQIANETLREYKAAYEARDIDRLARVWQMSEKQRDNTASFFQQMSKVSMSVTPGQVHENGEQLSVEFDQTISADGIPPTSARYVAILGRAGEARWTIQNLKPR